MAFNLPQSAIDEFIQIHKNLYGIELDQTSAEIQANQFISLINNVVKITNENIDEKLHPNIKSTA